MAVIYVTYVIYSGSQEKISQYIALPLVPVNMGREMAWKLPVCPSFLTLTYPLAFLQGLDFA